MSTLHIPLKGSNILIGSAFFALASLAFVIAWACKRHDIQGASGIAAWMVSLVILLFGWLQAFLG